MPKYLEGNTYVIDGKKQIYQPDGTFRDASIVAPPKPVDYVEPTPSPVAKPVPSTVPGEFNTPEGKAWAAAHPITPVTPGASPAVPKPIDTTGVQYNPDGTRVLSGAEKEISDYYAQNKPKTAEEIALEEQTIRERQLRQQQDAITGINSMYDNLLNQINKDNSSRLGSTASINALSGQRGSASGAANEVATQDANQKVVAANEAERNAKISGIMNNYTNQTNAELAKAKELRTTDANAWLEYKAGEIDRNKVRASNLRASFIAANMKPEEIDDNTYKAIAAAGGYTVEQAKALYKSEYDTNQKKFVNEEAKRVADLAKTAAETEKLKAEAGAKSQENLLINKGYVYVSTPAERDALKAQGKLLIEKDGKTYVAPSTMKTKVITKGNNQVLIDMSTGEEVKNLGPKPASTKAGGSDKNYTATTIPQKIKADLLFDKQSGGSLDQLMGAYPEVSTSYIQSLFADPDRLAY